MSEQKPAQESGQEQTPPEGGTKHGERSGGGGGRHQGKRRRSGGGGGGQQQQQSHARRSDPSLNMEELRELVELFTSNGLTDFEFENEAIRLHLRRNLFAPTAATPPVASTQTSAPVAPSTQAESTGSSAVNASAATEAAAPATTDEDLEIITSPIVGTFYRAPGPDREPFVRVGTSVGPDTVVCIIEAMKLMNEILAETTGVVEKIFVENGQPVEYGQPLFGIKK